MSRGCRHTQLNGQLARPRRQHSGEIGRYGWTVDTPGSAVDTPLGGWNGEGPPAAWLSQRAAPAGCPSGRLARPRRQHVGRLGWTWRAASCRRSQRYDSRDPGDDTPRAEVDWCGWDVDMLRRSIGVAETSTRRRGRLVWPGRRHARISGRHAGGWDGVGTRPVVYNVGGRLAWPERRHAVIASDVAGMAVGAVA
jgi:hypothetical protein